MSTWLVPPRTRLFHIGPHKTATTAVQATCSDNRAELLRLGVRYPGKSFNHRVPVSSFMGRSLAGAGGKAGSSRQWRRLKAEIDAETERRVLFGHEYAASSDDQMARRWVAELGPDLRVVITLRAFGRMVPSLWQERLKRYARREPYERWLRGVLTPERTGYDRRRAYFDHAGLIRRWAAAAGGDRVIVIALDPGDHSFVFRRFEDLLGLPTGALADAASGVGNRGLTAPEAELFRQLNRRTKALGLEWDNHEWLNYHGSLARVLAHRTVPASEARLVLPPWAVQPARDYEERVVQAVTESGVRLIGDPTHLLSAGDPAAPYIDPATITTIPIDLAVEALVGALGAATGRDADFERTAPAAVRKLRAEAARNARPGLAATLARLCREVVARLRPPRKR